MEAADAISNGSYRSRLSVSASVMAIESRLGCVSSSSLVSPVVRFCNWTATAGTVGRKGIPSCPQTKGLLVGGFPIRCDTTLQTYDRYGHLNVGVYCLTSYLGFPRPW